MGRIISAQKRAHKIKAKSLKICPCEFLKVKEVDQRSSSTGQSESQCTKGPESAQFSTIKVCAKHFLEGGGRSRAAGCQALGQAVADAARWSSAPWDMMPAWGSACTGMIHWIRLFTLASGMSCIRFEMQSRCFDLFAHCVLFALFFFGQKGCSQTVLCSCVTQCPREVPWAAVSIHCLLPAPGVNCRKH